MIRDINDDLRKNPFDVEFEKFSLALRVLVIQIFETIEKYGLKKRNLNKFKKSVEIFYKNKIERADYNSDIVRRYQKRFSHIKSSNRE